VIPSVLGSSPDVCDNLILTARKSLILKTERCPSGWRSTLGKRFRRAASS